MSGYDSNVLLPTSKVEIFWQVKFSVWFSPSVNTDINVILQIFKQLQIASVLPIFGSLLALTSF